MLNVTFRSENSRRRVEFHAAAGIKLGKGLAVILFLVGFESHLSLAAEPPKSEKVETPAKGREAVLRADLRGRLLTDEQTARAKVQPDDTGALWKFRVAPSTRKEHLLGRSWTFVVDNGVYTPFENYLLQRGGYGGLQPVPLAKRIEHLTGGGGGIACVLLADTEAKGEIIYLETAVLNRFPHAVQLELRGHQQAPWRLLLSSGCWRLASCSDDGSIRLWCLGPPGQKGQELAKFPGYGVDEKGNVTRGEFVDFSPYNRWLATEYKGKVSFRNARDGKEEFVWEPELLNGRRIMAINFAPNGKSLFAFLNNPVEKDDNLQFFQFMIKGRKERRFEGARPVIYGIITADCQAIITANGSAEISFWDLETREERHVLKIASHRMYDMTLSPLGETLATAGDDNEVKLWDVATRDRKQTEKPLRHEGVDFVRFIRKGTHLVTASDDGWLKMWDAPEFCHDRTELPVESRIDLDRGVIREVYKDGHVEFRKIPKDEE